MQNVTFEVKSEQTETDKSSSIGSPLHDIESMEAKVTRKIGGPRCKYGKPTKENRQALIHKIIHEGLSIRQAAKKVAINYSTAKSIYNLYKNEGRLGNDLSKDDDEDNSDLSSPSMESSEKTAQTENASAWITTQLPQKKVFQSQEETIKKKDPFTCLLFHQLNSVESKPRGFFTTDALGTQTKALLSSAFCVYTPPNTQYSNVIVAPSYQPNQMVLNPAGFSRPRYF